ncbi:hypothetical protein LTR10_010156 [Elasticomyces elasticus]|nr:hypothetical protein LTR10_010156 [Elasticomyces elasticus]KAK4972061.1 hypothetical protein LTR42_006566 [Elasticomyces elasticus]
MVKVTSSGSYEGIESSDRKQPNHTTTSPTNGYLRTDVVSHASQLADDPEYRAKYYDEQTAKIDQLLEQAEANSKRMGLGVLHERMKDDAEVMKEADEEEFQALLQPEEMEELADRAREMSVMDEAKGDLSSPPIQARKRGEAQQPTPSVGTGVVDLTMTDDRVADGGTVTAR